MQKVYKANKLENFLNEYFAANPECDRKKLNIRFKCDNSGESIFLDITSEIKQILGEIVTKAEYEIYCTDVQSIDRAIEEIERSKADGKIEFECDLIIRFINGKELKLFSAEWGEIYLK